MTVLVKYLLIFRVDKSKFGTFIAAYNALEKLKAEQEVDLYNAVLTLRYRQHEVVSTLVSLY